MFLPYLTGERTPYMNPNAKGMFFGLNIHHDWTNLVAAVFEGVVLNTAD